MCHEGTRKSFGQGVESHLDGGRQMLDERLVDLVALRPDRTDLVAPVHEALLDGHGVLLPRSGVHHDGEVGDHEHVVHEIPDHAPGARARDLDPHETVVEEEARDDPHGNLPGLGTWMPRFADV